jgi:hypothetical protein
LAASLTQHIFTTTYLLQDDGELQQILLHLAESDRGKEAFCRSLLFPIFEEKQLHVSQERVQSKGPGIIDVRQIEILGDRKP